MLRGVVCATVLVPFASLILLVGTFAGELEAKKRRFKVTYSDGRSEEYEYDDKTCNLIGWQKKVGLSFSLKTIKDYQASLGFSYDKIRQLDDLQKDFGLQYEALCNEYQRGVFAGDRIKLYDCRRANVDEALSALRALKVTLEPVRDTQTAESVKTKVTEIVDKVLKELVPGGFKGPCVGKHLFLGRDYVEITAGEAEKSIPVGNGGIYGIKWWPKTNFPQIYLDPSGGGQLGAHSDPTKLTIIRSPLHGGGVAEGEVWVEDDLGERARCTVKLAAAAARIERALDRLTGKTGEEAVKAAWLAAVDLAPNASSPVKDLMAGELLTINGNNKEAWTMLSGLSDQEPAISRQPEFQLAWGVSAYKVGDKKVALAAFHSATTGQYASLGAGYTAHALLAEGKQDEAKPYVNDFESDPKVSKDSWINRTLHTVFNIFLRPDAVKP